MDTSQKIQQIKTLVEECEYMYVKICDPEHVDRIYDLLMSDNVYEPETGIELLYMSFYYRENDEKHLLYSQLAHDKGNMDGTNNLAQIYEKEEQFELSEKLFRKACEMKCMTAYIAFSQFLKKRNRISEAKELIYHATELFPRKKDVYFALIRLCFFDLKDEILLDVESCEKLYLIAYSHNPKKMISHLIDFYYKYREDEIFTVFNTHCSKFPEDVNTLISMYCINKILISNLLKHYHDELKKKDNTIHDLELLVEHYKYRPQGYLDAKEDFEKRRFM